MTVCSSSSLDLIGNTPIVDVSQLSPSPRPHPGQDGGSEPGGSVRTASFWLDDPRLPRLTGPMLAGRDHPRGVVGSTGIKRWRPISRIRG